jgi:gamma-glutamylcysteine synthetase
MKQLIKRTVVAVLSISLLIPVAVSAHPHITTDYSEALLEFITPPQPSITEALHYLKDIHSVAHRHLEHGEKLWPLSMPCML